MINRVFVFLLMILFFSSVQAVELPSHTESPQEFSRKARGFILSICKTERPRTLFFKEALRKISNPGMDLSTFIFSNGHIDEWKNRNTKEQFVNGMSLDLLSTYEILWTNNGMSTDMRILLSSDIYNQTLDECFGEDESSKQYFTWTLMQADANSALSALGSGYLSNYFALKWIGVAVTKAGSLAQLGLESRAGLFVTKKLKKVGVYLQRYGAKVASVAALGYAYMTSMNEGYSAMETALTFNEKKVEDIDEQLRAAQDSKKEIWAVLKETQLERDAYISANRATESVLEDFNFDIQNLEGLYEGLKEEQRLLSYEKCKILFSQEIQITRCYSEHAKLIL